MLVFKTILGTIYPYHFSYHS